MFRNGLKVQTLSQVEKRNLDPCSWHAPEDLENLPSDYIGYVADGCVYDNCRTEYLRSLHRSNTELAARRSKFTKFKTQFSEATQKLTTLLTMLKTKDSLQHEISATSKILSDGFRFIKMHGNKRKKPIDEVETEKLEKQVKKLNTALKKAQADLETTHKILFEVIKTTHKYTDETIRKLNFVWNDYKNTVFMYNEFKELFKRVEDKIEDYDMIYDEIMSDIEALQVTEVKERRAVRHKARYYIDEQGNKQELNMDQKQEIIHKI